MTQRPASATETGLGIEQGPNRYADTPEAAKGPQIADLDSGAIGRLEDALAPFVRCGERYCDTFDNGNRGCEDCRARVIVVAALVGKHVTAALAEFEAVVAKWDWDPETHHVGAIHGEILRDLHAALRIVHNYREEVGR